MAPLLSDQQKRVSSENALTLYKEIAVGPKSWLHLIWYEFVMAIGGFLPGLLGVGFRSFAYPLLFESCGRRPYVGKGVALRNPGAISLGNKVLIDNEVTIDARVGSTISVGNSCAIGKGSIVAAKGGNISFASGVNIGTYCRVATQTGVSIGESTLVAAYCYIGPGNHEWDEESGSFITGAMDLKGGVSIGSNCWIGTRATILDGVTIGDGAMVGAHSLVKEDVPPKTIVVGVPAKPIGTIGS